MRETHDAIVDNISRVILQLGEDKNLDIDCVAIGPIQKISHDLPEDERKKKMKESAGFSIVTSRELTAEEKQDIIQRIGIKLLTFEVESTQIT